MTFVDGLQVIGFPPPCHPSYEALALTSAGLSPAERASLCWTHKYSLQLSAALPKTTMLCQSTRCWRWPCLSVYASSVATEKLATGCPLVGRCRSSGSWPRWPMRVTLLSDISLSSFCAPRLGLQPGRGAFVYLFAGSCPSAFHVAPSALAAPSAFRSEMKQFQWNTALLAHRWSARNQFSSPFTFRPQRAQLSAIPVTPTPSDGRARRRTSHNQPCRFRISFRQRSASSTVTTLRS